MNTIPPFIHLSDNPAARGFWNDEELLEWSGGSSVAVIKQMQRVDLLKPRLEKSGTGSGQNARAWNITDVLRVAVVVEMAKETGLNLSSNVAIAGSLGKLWLDEATSAEAMNAAIHEVLNGSVPSPNSIDRLPASLEKRSPDLVHLAIVDRGLVYALRRSSEKDKFQSYILAELSNGGESTLQVSNLLKGPIFDIDHMHEERSVLRIKLVNLAARPVEVLRSRLREIRNARFLSTR